MPTVITPGVADFDELMHQVVLSFRVHNPGHARFEDLYPDSVRCEATSMAQWRVVRSQGRIVAGMQVVPRALVAADSVHVSAGGLANVFCVPDHRGQGLMSALLRTVVREMPANGQVLSLLGGDRTRYGHFGWETAGAVRRVSLSLHTVRHAESAGDGDAAVRTWPAPDVTVERLWQAYCRLPYRTERSLEAFGLVLQRPGQVVWIGTADDQFAYVSVQGRRIVEYAGEARALAPVLKELLRGGSMTVDLPPAVAQTPLEDLLLCHASSYAVHPIGMIRVNRLVDVLSAYRPLLERRLQGWEGTALLTLADDVEEHVRVEGTGHGLVIEPAPKPAGEAVTVRAPRRHWALLLFGPFPPALGTNANDAFLRRAFPLPVFWHPLSHV